MPKSIRVKLDPTPSGEERGRARRVLGARVRLTPFGSGKTKGQRGSSVPAVLTFKARFFERIRDDAGTEPETVASLKGSLALSSTTGEPRFTLDANAAAPLLLEPEAPLEESGEGAKRSSSPRRSLKLEFDSAHFPGLRDPHELALPAKAEDFAFVELGVELEVAGAVESGLDQNDVLDVPLLADSPAFFPAFEVTVVDELGEPVEGLELEFAAGEKVLAKQTDARGVARLFKPGATVVNLTLPDHDELEPLLAPRWAEARGGTRILPSNEVLTLFVRDGMQTTTPLEAGAPMVISLQPSVERARLVRFFFDPNKTFILPDLPGARNTLLELYQRHTPSKLLIVGHTDRSGDQAYNDQLSLERAETLLAYLRDDVDAWLEWYDSGVPKKKRWGSAEDLAMLGALPDGGEAPEPGETPVFRFQRTRGLKVDGIAGPETRRALVTEFLALDEATLPAEIEATVHGAGEHFPDTGATDGAREPDDRRAELFFFDADLGIQPPPPGKNSKAGSKEYPEWLRRSELTDLAGRGAGSVAIKLLDVLNQPLVGAPYKIKIGDDVRSGRTDARGFLVETHVRLPNRCRLRWGYPPAPNEPEGAPTELVFTREMLLDYSDLDESNQKEAARRRLSNLGYVGSFEQQVNDFQADFDLSEGPFDQATFDELKRVHDNV